jgi:hypothetical protein
MRNMSWRLVAICLGLTVSRLAASECAIAEESKLLDPVEVGFCESDAVFVGKVENRVETIRAYREEGSDRTKHYRLEVSTIKLDKQYKGSLPEKVTMNADLYDKKTGAFSFELTKEYLVFAKRLPAGEYAGASAMCSVQPTLPLADAKHALDQLEQHRKGTKKIDCKNMRKRLAGGG